jgi:hypothetical protein
VPYLVLALVYGIVDGRRGVRRPGGGAPRAVRRRPARGSRRALGAARRAHLRPGVADLDRRRLMWTPGRDPEKFPVCPTCKEIYEKLRDE